MSTKTSTNQEVEIQSKVAKPTKYKIYLLNDDFTPMEFVVAILKEIYGKDDLSAQALMMKVHKEQRAMVGIYYKDIAEYKVELTKEVARLKNYPLNCKMEKE